jgi:hypothetical protein
VSKSLKHRRDVYRAIEELNCDNLIVEDIVEFVRWDNCKETRTHYVRDAIRDMEFDGVISVTKGEDGKTLVIRRTDQFGMKLIRNPWLGLQGVRNGRLHQVRPAGT